ncbi:MULTISPECIES: HpcH/HpaI aldolase/citrate lyase family protein [Streptosporangium]|uniref:Citrate lyase subunit beta/citryl-CoA lyase n=1 Tax=Streptosporangium brasiliense TaxID=47480 RepID=A0ABT9RE56_9ACTN|nr:CoA ester lyase [Streptosporangium brasiliense]MDP9867019.1 citrate lyase subunit beta/citryl-CoA lyase [Streptosporangium brasiliense]
MIRSALYVPGDQPDKLAKALGRGSDSLIVDLEDAVLPAHKAAARTAVAGWLRGLGPGGPEIYVRVNPGQDGHEDLRAVALPGVRGVCVAKTESAAEVAAVDAVLSEAEAAEGLPAGSIEVCPLLESAGAILAAPEIARAPRVSRLQIGEADLRADLGVETGPDERELLWARSQVVLASAAARLAPPLAPISTDFRDLDALRASTVALKRLGFRGRTCIHPAQVAVVNEVFTPTEEELVRARDLIARFEEAGTGVVTDAQGRMVDEAIVRAARRLLS